MQTYVADLEVEDSFVGWGSLGLGLVKITVLRRLLVDSRALEGPPGPRNGVWGTPSRPPREVALYLSIFADVHDSDGVVLHCRSDLGFEGLKLNHFGKSYEHGVSTHATPHATNPAFATFKIPDAAKTRGRPVLFSAVVGVNDNNNRAGMAGSELM